MYTKHQVILILFSIIAGVICCVLEFNLVIITSDIVSVVSISSALYLAAYAGIQASPELRKRLKVTDDILKNKSQLTIINNYIKVALVLNIVTIISVCTNSLISDRIVRLGIESGCYTIRQLVECCMDAVSLKQDIISITWLSSGVLFNSLSASLFTANLVQMSFIGKFVVNRIGFDK